MPIDPAALTPDEIARHWIAKWSPDQEDPEPDYDRMLFDHHIEPMKWLDAVVAALPLIPVDDVNNLLGNLAAGPMEDLLVMHGSTVIERVELLARNRRDFAYMLGGVWRNDIRQEVWDRVQAVADETW